MVQIHSDDSFLRFIKGVGRPAMERTLPVDSAPHDLGALYKIAAETGQPVIGPPMSAEEAEAIVASAR
jgi:hypothetical protein